MQLSSACKQLLIQRKFLSFTGFFRDSVFLFPWNNHLDVSFGWIMCINFCLHSASILSSFAPTLTITLLSSHICYLALHLVCLFQYHHSIPPLLIWDLSFAVWTQMEKPMNSLHTDILSWGITFVWNIGQPGFQLILKFD